MVDGDDRAKRRFPLLVVVLCAVLALPLILLLAIVVMWGGDTATLWFYEKLKLW